MKAMILAAGRGKRLDPLTATTPKPLIKVGNKPLIQYHIENLASAGIKEIVINTCWLGEQIESYFGDGSSFGLTIKWSKESELLETGGGVSNALHLLGREPFLLINADIWSNFLFSSLVEKKLPPNIDANLILIPKPAHNKGGDFTLKSGSIVGIPTPQQITYTFSGISILRPEIFTKYVTLTKSFPLLDLLSKHISLESVMGSIYRGIWWDSGTLENLEALDSFLTKN